MRPPPSTASPPSGEKFGDTMGQKAMRAFVMLGTVAVGNTASGMAATLPRLPGAGQAAVVAEAQLGIRWTAPALAQVESVALTAEGVTIALAPNAVAMAARGSSGGKAGAQAAPPSSGGPGEWVQATESMSEQARRYQAQVTGAPEGTAYRVKWGEQGRGLRRLRPGSAARGQGHRLRAVDRLRSLEFLQDLPGARPAA